MVCHSAASTLPPPTDWPLDVPPAAAESAPLFASAPAANKTKWIYEVGAANENQVDVAATMAEAAGDGHVAKCMRETTCERPLLWPAGPNGVRAQRRRLAPVSPTGPTRTTRPAAQRLAPTTTTVAAGRRPEAKAAPLSRRRCALIILSARRCFIWPRNCDFTGTQVIRRRNAAPTLKWQWDAPRNCVWARLIVVVVAVVAQTRSASGGAQEERVQGKIN